MVKKETVKEKQETKKPIKKTVKKVDKKEQKKVEKAKDVTPKGFKALRLELGKVKWPSKKEMIKYSIATIVFVLFFGAFFYLIELLMAFLKTLV